MLGLVLEGGGAKGAYHIGALTALFELGYQFDGVTGTSIGALNGAMLAQGQWELLNELWNDVRISTIMAVDDTAMENLLKGNINRDVVGYLKDKIKSLGAVIDQSTTKLHSFIESYIDEEKIRNSPMDFGFVTYSLSDLQPYELLKENVPEGQMCDYIVASANYPLFRAKQIDGKKFIDGGVYDNMPIKLLQKKGYDHFIAIRTRGRAQKRFETMYGDLDITYIVPSEKLSSAMNFSAEKVQYYKRLGYFDAQRVLGGRLGKRYCFSHVSDQQFMDYLMRFPDEMFLEPLYREKLPISTDKEENIIAFFKFIQRELDLSEDTGIIDTYIAFIEPFAEIYQLDRFKEYTFEEIGKLIYKQCKYDVFDRDGKAKKSRLVKSEAVKWAFMAVAKFLPMRYNDLEVL